MKKKIIYLICGLCWLAAALIFSFSGIENINSAPHIAATALCIVGVFLFLVLFVAKRR